MGGIENSTNIELDLQLPWVALCRRFLYRERAVGKECEETSGKVATGRACRRGRMLDVSRVQKELVEVQRDKDLSGVSIQICGDDLTHMTGTIEGPSGTPYEGGIFTVDIHLPPAYPFEPPKMQFITKVWHPNISSQNGAICLNILKDQWSPALTIKAALLSLQVLLSAPEPRDPQDAVVAEQYLKQNSTFMATARYWTESFAKRTSIGLQEKITKFVEMGFTEEVARAALQSVGGDENAALEKLFSG